MPTRLAGAMGMTSIHRITQLHTAHRGGMNSAVDADIGGVAKTNDESPYTIANEVIATRIGQTLGLPVPAGVIAEDDAKRLYYFSLDVSRERKQLPPIIPANFAREEPWLAAGTAVFDVLIANGDRNPTNLSRDPAFDPPRVSVFDHGHALLGTNPPTGWDRLRLAEDRLGCIDDSANIASDTVLREQELDSAHMELWTQRVAALPKYVFDDICADVARTPALGLNATEARNVALWLARRAAMIGGLVWDNRDAFPGICWGLWGPEGQPS